MASIDSIEIQGFRSLKNVVVELRNLNVLIGANGSGKSNFIAFFKMLNEMIAGRLQLHIGLTGRAGSLLHFGPKVTPQFSAKIVFRNEDSRNTYTMRMAHAANDAMLFTEETLDFRRDDFAGPHKPPLSLSIGQLESRINDAADDGNKTAGVFRKLLQTCRVFHFHDTSATTRMRQYCYIGDNRWLMHDGGNLAAVLYAYKQSEPKSYNRIVSIVKKIVPGFQDFVLEPDAIDPRNITLNWRKQYHDYVFGSHQLSDGSLLAIALSTLLLQHKDRLPNVIIIDEPELGLHPYALSLISGLIRAASVSCQVIVATQSESLLDEFEPDEIITLQNRQGETVFERLSNAALSDWLEDYSVGELWKRNVIAGGPLP
jgi:predicted ATPase